jgi:hypothetical protein
VVATGTIRNLLHLLRWRARKFSMPAPQFVKDCVVRRYLSNHDLIIESGTYRGHTTQLLSKLNSRVISIEMEDSLFEFAQRKFRNVPNIELIRGRSEEVLGGILNSSKVQKLGIFLDAHKMEALSSDNQTVTPILQELNSVEYAIGLASITTVLIDDIRFFDKFLHPDYLYPNIDLLVDWSRRCGFSWRIENDIFIAIRS